MKKAIAFILAALAVFSLSGLAVRAERVFLFDVYLNGKAASKLTNGSYADCVEATELTVSASSEIRGLYIIFYDTPADVTVYSDGEIVHAPADYLHKFISLENCPSVEIIISFDGKAALAEVTAYGSSSPDGVQIWEPPCEAADLLLCTTHADDEQLFFAGILPYYAGERGFDVQVIYFTDHTDKAIRRHELLNGLWTVGVTHYPVIGILPDEYSRSNDAEDAYDWAVENAASHGITEDDLVSFYTDQIRRFKPLIAVCHDLRGEYGHGQHILNVRTFLKAAEQSGDPENCKESAETYGVWDVKKIYVHLYDENEVVMDFDKPLDAFGGLTAFQVSQRGFACHHSQHGGWFDDWMYGKNRTLSKAADINVDPYKRSDCYYSPCRYGLYKSTVGEDVLCNDLAENIETYKEKAEREAEESRIAESESISAAEESMRIYESESISEALESLRIYESESLSEWESESRFESEEASRIESEAESLSQAAESKRAAVSESKRLAAEERERKFSSSAFTVIFISVGMSLAVSSVIFVILKKRRI